jgi:N-acetylneuraminic acid mutarotase
MAQLFCTAIVCLLGMEIPAAWGLAFSSAEVPVKVSSIKLTFTERVAYQRAIEEVYWRHRIWPNERAQPKPPLDLMISQAQLEKKVEEYLRKSRLVADRRGFPITPSELQAEMDRMVRDTKQPDVLHELFAALGNDPFVIAECLAGPTLVDRLTADLSVAGDGLRTPSGSLIAGTAASTENHIAGTTRVDNVQYKLPEIALADCTDDAWTATSTTEAPDAREFHTAVWTGSELIVWGGFNFSPPYRLNTGGRYNPSTDSWISTSLVNAPAQRDYHSAVWTGTEMIVWGGEPILDTGGRYNPIMDTWTATSSTNAPSARAQHTAVWTGSEMVVWGGRNCCTRFNSGGRYNPSTDSWTATSTTNAPEARWAHTAEWTGSEMIVWGGTNQTIYLNTGAKYNPTNNSWTPTTTAGAPLGRIGHTSVWSGSEMIVWGGADSTFHDANTGGRYNPTANSWSATSINNAPSPRDSHAAAWTGSEMIVWGGIFCCPVSDFDTGGRYNPGTDNWTPTSTANVPIGRYNHTALWTGSEMIVWGGFNYELQIFFNSGGRYCAPSGPTPTPTPTPVPITLSAAGRKVGGINTVRLTWSGATSTNINVYRNGVVIATVPNTGRYTDSTGDTGRARYTYRVCEGGTSTCSNNARVTFRQ